MVCVAFGLLPAWLFSQENHQQKSYTGYPQLIGEIVFATMQYSGSPYLFDRFTGGNVIMLSGTEVPVSFLRYDALNDELFWMQPDEKGLVKVDKNLIAGFHLEHPSQDSLLRFYRNAVLEIDGLRCRDCFIQVLYEGEFSLYTRRSKRITSRSETITQGSRSQRVRILDDDFSYMLIYPDGTMQTVRPSIRSLINALPINNRELRQAMRSDNIQINNDKELVQAVKWFNSFIEQPKEISE
ncbi:MAG: hypothetical protein EA393_03320 [Bacteroidetes bacterium]|nr:MAG: hypothetical protein EA393_03320 [Bacteroidota bacterium]